MNLRGRIEKLENRRASEGDTITLSDLVNYSYRGPNERDFELENRISRSRLGRLLAECRFGVVGSPAAESQESDGGAHV